MSLLMITLEDSVIKNRCFGVKTAENDLADLVLVVCALILRKD
jgi:hypothetical protein